MIISYLLVVLYDRNYRVIVFMWRPFRALSFLFGRNWDIRTSVIDAFSAFFLLTNGKFLSVTFDLLIPTQVYHLYGDTYNYTLGLFYAADMHRILWERASSLWHLGYSYSVCVCHPTDCYPCSLSIYFLPEVPKSVSFSLVHFIHTFVDSFQGCYKDGTEQGTRDCRWFSAAYLAFRVIALFLYGITQNGSYFVFCSMVSLLVLSS